MADKEVIIAVMGVTGAGKSTFIQTATQNKDAIIGHGLKSETTTTSSYNLEHNGIKFVLVDCPGFNDTERSDEEILGDIVSWFGRSYHEGKLVSAVIYLHKINDTRIQGTTMIHLEILRQLCGENFYPRIILGTTFWASVGEEEGARREKELLSTQGFFAEMHELGSQTTRVYEDRAKCLSLIEKIAGDQGQAMQVQEEFCRGADVRSTSAFRFLVRARSNTNLSQSLHMVYLKLTHLLQWIFHAVYYLVLQLFASIANKWKLVREQARKRRELDEHTRPEREEMERERQRQLLREKTLLQINSKARNELATAEKNKRALEKEQKRQEKVIQDAQRRMDWDDKHRQYEIDILKWKQKKSEALQKYDITASQQTLVRNSGGLTIFGSCSQPSCGRSLWLQNHSRCEYCAAKWCGSCRPGLRVLHTISCPSYKTYGGLEEQEALKRSGFRDRKPCPPAPLSDSEADVRARIATIMVAIVIVALFARDWTSVLLLPMRLFLWLLGVNLYLIFGTLVGLFYVACFLIGTLWAFVHTILALLFRSIWFFIWAPFATLKGLFGVILTLIEVLCRGTVQGLLLMVLCLWWTLCTFIKLAFFGVGCCVGVISVAVQLAWAISFGLICLPFSLLTLVFS